MHVRLGHQRHAKRLNHFHLSCRRKLFKSRWQVQYSRYRGPEEGMDAKSTYYFKACTAIRWTGYVTRMTDERLPTGILWRTTGLTLSSWPKELLQKHPVSLKDFNIPTESWEQGCTGSNNLIKKQLSMKQRKSVKLKEGKAGPNSSSSESLFSELTCNRHYRDEIGLSSQ